MYFIKRRQSGGDTKLLMWVSGWKTLGNPWYIRDSCLQFSRYPAHARRASVALLATTTHLPSRRLLPWCTECMRGVLVLLMCLLIFDESFTADRWHCYAHGGAWRGGGEGWDGVRTPWLRTHAGCGARWKETPSVAVDREIETEEEEWDAVTCWVLWPRWFRGVRRSAEGAERW